MKNQNKNSLYLIRINLVRTLCFYALYISGLPFIERGISLEMAIKKSFIAAVIFGVIMFIIDSLTKERYQKSLKG